MKVVWDEAKRDRNLAKHGLDFATVGIEFFVAARIAEAKHGRYQALGRLDGRIVVAIFARLGVEAFSLVSLRPASAKERREL